MKPNRKQRRQMERQKKRVEKTKIVPKEEKVRSEGNSLEDRVTKLEQHMNSVFIDLNKLLRCFKTVEHKVKLLVETLDRKEMMGWEDIRGTEQLYFDRLEKRHNKIKELLSLDFTVPEYLQEIDEDPNLPGYEKMNIHPIDELNLNPYEVAFYIKEAYPNKSKEEYLKLGSVWQLTESHFGYKKEVSK